MKARGIMIHPPSGLARLVRAWSRREENGFISSLGRRFRTDYIQYWNLGDGIPSEDGKSFMMDTLAGQDGILATYIVFPDADIEHLQRLRTATLRGRDVVREKTIRIKKFI